MRVSATASAPQHEQLMQTFDVLFADAEQTPFSIDRGQAAVQFLSGISPTFGKAYQRAGQYAMRKIMTELDEGTPRRARLTSPLDLREVRDFGDASIKDIAYYRQRVRGAFLLELERGAVPTDICVEKYSASGVILIGKQNGNLPQQKFDFADGHDLFRVHACLDDTDYVYNYGSAARELSFEARGEFVGLESDGSKWIDTVLSMAQLLTVATIEYEA